MLLPRILDEYTHYEQRLTATGEAVSRGAHRLRRGDCVDLDPSDTAPSPSSTCSTQMMAVHEMMAHLEVGADPIRSSR